MRHYQAVGVSHFFFLDNGSTDGTVEALQRYENITILHSKFPYRKNYTMMKQYLVDRFAKTGWFLQVDIDELFDYPLRDQLPLRGLVEYLRHYGFDAMLTPMLDMYPAEFDPRSGADFDPGEQRLYELATIRHEDYPVYYQCRLPAPELPAYWAGVRSRVFGVENLCLVKHALMRQSGSARRSNHNDHFVVRAKVADVMGVLFHYKFVGSFSDTVADAIRRKQHHNDSSEYKKYAEKLMADPKILLKCDQSLVLDGVEDLVENGFLKVSPALRAFAERRSAQQAAE